jgi:hypothetical protein
LAAARQLILPVITSMAILAFIPAEKAGFGPGNLSFLYGMVYRFYDNHF